MTDAIIACAKAGGSIQKRCVELGIHISTYYEWINPNSAQYHEEFHRAHEMAQLLSEVWWQDKGQQHLTFVDRGERLDSQNYRLQMMNRFGWSEKGQQEVSNTGDIVLTLGKKADGNSNS